MTEPWHFGLDPLPQAVEVAPLLRRVAGLVQSLDAEHPAVEALLGELRAAEAALGPAEVAPRVGDDPPAGARPYVQHARHVGASNPCFPEYEIEVDGARASGTVTFPVVFEGPPGLVHGGVLATFVDCAVQHHNCDAGTAGKTTSLHVDYRRPTPLGVPLRFEIDRSTDGHRITSALRLLLDGTELCAATVEAVAGDRSNLPTVWDRR